MIGVTETALQTCCLEQKYMAQELQPVNIH